MWRNLTRIIVGLMSLSAVAACSAFDDTIDLVMDLACEPGTVCLICEDLSLDNVDHVELVPGFTFTGPGQEFRMEAVPVLANGLPVRGQGILVTWSPKPFFQDEGAIGVFTIPTDAVPQEITGISPNVNGRTSQVPGGVRVGRPPASTVGDVLQVPHTDGGRPEAVLVDWPLPDAGSGCTISGSQGFAMAGEAHLDTSLKGQCPPDVAVFGVNTGAQFKKGVAPTEGGTTPPPDPVAFPAVPVRSVLALVRTDLAAPADPITFGQAVNLTKALASHAFATNRTGISFAWGDYPESFAPTGPVSVPFPYSCEDGALTTPLGIPLTLDAPDGEALDGLHELYVVFVPEITGQYPGYLCDRTPRRGPVIVLSATHFTPTTLAHEMAHLFGMGLEMEDFGHTEGRTGFTAGNLLQGAPDVCSGQSRESLTLGQLYRMNFDTGSWLRHQAASVDFLTECNSSFGEDKCPAAAADFPRGNN